MTAQDAIRWIDEKKHNVFSLEDKLEWLGQVEAMAAELAARYAEKRETACILPETVLMVPAPYDGVYLRWLEAQIDYTNQEYSGYNNAMALFNALWMEYAKSVCREQLRKAGTFRYFGGGTA